MERKEAGSDRIREGECSFIYTSIMTGRSDTCLIQMSSEQIGQLYELMHATKEVWKSPEQLEQLTSEGKNSE